VHAVLLQGLGDHEGLRVQTEVVQVDGRLDPEPQPLGRSPAGRVGLVAVGAGHREDGTVQELGAGGDLQDVADGTGLHHVVADVGRGAVVAAMGSGVVRVVGPPGPDDQAVGVQVGDGAAGGGPGVGTGVEV